MLGEDLVVVPVRHHSPGCALQVGRAVERLRPRAVLVEGPRSFTGLVPLLTDPATVPPVAVYAWAAAPDGVTRHGAYHPFCEHSPELVAVRAGAALGSDVRFVDLDPTEQWLLDRAGRGEAPAPVDERAGRHGTGPRASEGRTGPLQDERHLRHSRSLSALAARLGCRDHEELWEHLFEVDAPHLDLRQHVERVVAYCLLARTDSDGAALERDGTLAREAEMAWHVAQALDRPGDGPVLAVVGGFHGVVLPGLVAAVRGGALARPAVTVPADVVGGHALVRYSSDRLDRLQGYAAGMTSPAWHRRVWRAVQEGADAGAARRAVALDVLQDVADLAQRQSRRTVPLPLVQAGYEQALGLAALRGRAGPVREDVVDACGSAFVSGDVDTDGAGVLAALRSVLVGDDLGRVPPGAGRPPLLADTEARARALRLHVDDVERRRADLDVYRRPDHRRTSRFLHALGFLGVPFAVRQAGPDFVHDVDLHRVRERWEYAWGAATEAALVERSAYGSTLADAVRARFEEHVTETVAEQAPDALRGARTLVHACVLGLHDAVPDVRAHVTAALAADPSFASVARATATLAVLLRAREPLEADRVPDLQALVRAAGSRALYLARGLAAEEPADTAAEEETADGLVRLRGLLLEPEAATALDEDVLWQVVAAAADAVAQPLLAGAATGLLHAAGRLAPGALGARLAGRLAGAGDPAAAASYLVGVLRTAREAAWQDDDVVRAVDDRLAEWDDVTFVAALPRLRLAFTGLTPRETDRVAEAVAARHGRARLDVSVVREVTAEEAAGAAALSADVVAALDAHGLAGWTR